MLACVRMCSIAGTAAATPYSSCRRPEDHQGDGTSRSRHAQGVSEDSAQHDAQRHQERIQQEEARGH